jgi:hypothetical protein
LRHGGLTKFVGSEAELVQIRRALELAIDGHGQIVATMEEAGVRSRDCSAMFKARISATCNVLEACSVSHGKGSA